MYEASLKLAASGTVLFVACVLKSDWQAATLSWAIVLCSPPMPSTIEWLKRPDSADILALLQPGAQPKFLRTRRWWLRVFAQWSLSLVILINLTILRDYLASHAPWLLPKLRWSVTVVLILMIVGYALGWCVALILMRWVHVRSSKP
jgi:hypothetical protein